MREDLNIPNSWIQIPLSDLFLDPNNSIVDGPFGSNLKASEYKAEGIPVLRIQNIDRNRFVDKNINYVTEEKAELLSRHSFRSGDIIITKLGIPVGKACFVPEKFERGIIVADLIRARIDHKNINAAFLAYQINSSLLIKQFDAFTKGTTRPRIKLSIVRGLKFSLPPFNEQQRIVDIIEELFSHLENGVVHLKLAQNQLKVYRQALLKYAFEGKLTAQWRKENNPEPANRILKCIQEERKKRYRKEVQAWKEETQNWKDTGKKGEKPRKPQLVRILSELEDRTSLAQLPTHWKWIKIGEFEERIGSGATPKGGKDVYLGEGIPFIRSMNVYPNKLVLGGLTYIDQATHDKMERSQLKEKDVLLNITGASIGRCALVPKGFGIGNVNQHVCIIRSFTDIIQPEYLCLYLNSPNAQRKISSINSGATREALTFEQIRNFPFPLATIEEQNFIVNELDSKFSIVNELEAAIDSSILKSEGLRQSILKKAFAGQLVAQDPKDEPASQLLQRIEAEKKTYMEEQKEIKRNLPKKVKNMNKELSIEDVLKTADRPMLALEVWKQSEHKENIEEFYAALREIQERIKEVKKGTESFLSLVK